MGSPVTKRWRRTKAKLKQWERHPIAVALATMDSMLALSFPLLRKQIARNRPSLSDLELTVPNPNRANMNVTRLTLYRKFDRRILCVIVCCSIFSIMGCRQMGDPSSKAIEEPVTLTSTAAVDVQFAMAKTFEQTGKTDKAIAAYQKLAS